MNAKDVMTPQVVSVAPEESVLVAARLMLQKKISGLPVRRSADTVVAPLAGLGHKSSNERVLKYPTQLPSGDSFKPTQSARRAI